MNKEQEWIFNPDYSFKNDIDRVCMYSRNNTEYESTKNWIGYIHPVHAMIFGIFTVPTCLKDVVYDLSNKLHLTIAQIEDFLSKFMANEQEVYIEWAGIKIMFPKNVLLQFNEIKHNKFTYDFSVEDLKCESINLSPDRMHRAPHTALWMLTTKCGTDCKYCYADRKTDHVPMPTDMILKIIKRFHELKIIRVDIIGGEVFLHKDWNVILQKLVEYDMQPMFISTKLPISRQVADKLVATGYSKLVQFSLDSLSDEVLMNTIGTTYGYAEKIVSSIKMLDYMGFPIQIDTVITSKNVNVAEIDSLYQFISTIKNLTLWEIRVPEVSIYAHHSFKSVMGHKKDIEDLKDYVYKNIIKKANFEVVFSSESLDAKYRCEVPEKRCFNGGSCGILTNRVFILPDGKVSVCEQLYWHNEYIVGDLKVSDIEDIWNSEKALKLFGISGEMFRENSPCKKCRFSDLCNKRKRRCPVKVIKAYGPENWDYPDPRCVFAPEVNDALEYL